MNQSLERECFLCFGSPLEMLLRGFREKITVITFRVFRIFFCTKNVNFRCIGKLQ